VALGVGLQAAAGVVDGALLADAGEDVLQEAALGDVVVYVVTGDERDADLFGEGGHASDVLCVGGFAGEFEGEKKVRRGEGVEVRGEPRSHGATEPRRSKGAGRRAQGARPCAFTPYRTLNPEP
jgi:hypothetical protein